MKASTVTGYALATSAGSPPCAPPIGLRLLRPGRRFVGVSPLPMWNGTFSLAKALHPAVPESTCMPRPGRGTGRRAERGPVSLGPASRGLHLSAPGYYFGVRSRGYFLNHVARAGTAPVRSSTVHTRHKDAPMRVA